MCKAVEEMVRSYKAEGRAEGIAQGKAEGIAQGKAEGIAEGKAEGIIIGEGNGILKAIYGLVQSGDITPERAIERAKEYDYKDINSMDDFKRKIAEAKRENGKKA